MASSLHTLILFFLSSLWLTLHAIANFVLGSAGLILLHVRVLELQSVKTLNFARPGLAALLLLNCTKHSNFLFHLKIHETGGFFFFFYKIPFCKPLHPLHLTISNYNPSLASLVLWHTAAIAVHCITIVCRARHWFLSQKMLGSSLKLQVDFSPILKKFF